MATSVNSSSRRSPPLYGPSPLKSQARRTPSACVANLDNVRTVAKRWFDSRAGALAPGAASGSQARPRIRPGVGRIHRCRFPRFLTGRFLIYRARAANTVTTSSGFFTSPYAHWPYRPSAFTALTHRSAASAFFSCRGSYPFVSKIKCRGPSPFIRTMKSGTYSWVPPNASAQIEHAHLRSIMPVPLEGLQNRGSRKPLMHKQRQGGHIEREPLRLPRPIEKRPRHPAEATAPPPAPPPASGLPGFPGSAALPSSRAAFRPSHSRAGATDKS
jgi:hypothetical protein